MFLLLDSGANLSCIPYCNAFLYLKDFCNINQNTSLKHSARFLCAFLKKINKRNKDIVTVKWHVFNFHLFRWWFILAYVQSLSHQRRNKLSYSS